MPVNLPQLSTLPESQDEAQPGLKQTQGGLAHVVDQLLLARSNDIGPPQQQPGIDQRQGQQQARQAVAMAHASEFQSEAPASVFEIFKHFLNPEALGVARTGEFTGRFGRYEIP